MNHYTIWKCHIMAVKKEVPVYKEDLKFLPPMKGSFVG
jgi:hypothetical protein